MHRPIHIREYCFFGKLTMQITIMHSMINLSILYCVLKYNRVDAAGFSEAAVDAAGSLEAAVCSSSSTRVLNLVQQPCRTIRSFLLNLVWFY